MMSNLSRRLFTVAVLCAGTSTLAGNTRCDVCGQRISGKYWTVAGKTCCSQACVNQLAPRCDECGRTITGKYIESNGKIYCSDACFEKTLPRCECCGKPIRSGFSIGRHQYCATCTKNKPTCFSCGLPAKYPTRLDDGREICTNCMRWSVKTQEMAQKHFERSLRHLQAWTSIELTSVPKLELVDRDQMNELSSDLRKTDSPVSVRGLYSRQTYMVKRGLFGKWKAAPEKDEETIYIVNHLHDEVFRVAALHELMHDLIHEQFQHLEKAPLWVQEGICQQAAAEYCRRRNYVDILTGIETCSDPDYGDGYRYINKQTGFEGWYALKRWMESANPKALPKKAPKV